MTTAEIKALWPKPTSAFDGLEKGSYCVGGALCSAAGVKNFGFPTPGFICRALLYLWPGSDDLHRWDVACAIVKANDNGDFEKAWSLVSEVERTVKGFKQ